MSTKKLSLTAPQQKELVAEYQAGKYAAFINQVLEHSNDYTYGLIGDKISELIDCLEIFRDYVGNDVDKFIRAVKAPSGDLAKYPEFGAANLKAFDENDFRYTKFFDEISERLGAFRALNKALTQSKSFYVEKIDPKNPESARILLGCYKDIKGAAKALAEELGLPLHNKIRD